MQASFGLEMLLDKITAPDKPEEDWALINDFCKQVKSEGDSGAAGVIQILLDKMRAKNEQTALLATTTLEAVVKSCGLPIHQIVGKFRFLNELIKMVSPKYYANTPVSVKNRIYAMFTQWNFSLVDQPKVREAYQMLLKQGVTFPDGLVKPELNVPCGDGYMEVNAAAMTRRVSPLEEDKKKAAMLEKLLKSKDPNDLMKANRLIKKMVELDAKKNELSANVRREMQKVRTNVKLLTEMLQHFSPESDGPLEKSEVIQDLYRSCQSMRPQMFKLAGDLNHKEDVLGEVLQANDDLTRVMDMYLAVKEKQASASSSNGAGGAASRQSDLIGSPSAGADSLLSLDLLGGGGAGAAAPAPAPAQTLGGGLDDLLGLSMGPSTTAPAPAATGASSGLGGLFDMPAPAAAPPSNGADMMGLGGLMGGPPASNGLDAMAFGGAPSVAAAPPPLDQVNVTLQTVQPGDFPPVTMYEKNNLKAQLFFAKNSPHPLICVAVCSFMNFGPTPVDNLNFQAAVPKQIEVKLLPPTGTTLPTPNPMLGQQAVTQLMLIRNPTKVPIRIRFKLSYTANGQVVDDMGEVSNFPPM
eukprot:m.438922 g.438922  ORF g.438922 m.438922 type:complete len:581 (+) comp18305_c0_seq1:65-1807(+)